MLFLLLSYSITNAVGLFLPPFEEVVDYFGRFLSIFLLDCYFLTKEWRCCEFAWIFFTLLEVLTF